MTLHAFPERSAQPEIVTYHVRLLGTGASAPTIEEGSALGITIARGGVGDYTLTWSESPGTFVNCSHMLGAATPADLAGHTLIRDTFASNALPMLLSNAAEAAHDLAANEYIDLSIRFKRTAI